jgi:choice-of-anchor A domain-containing protein
MALRKILAWAMSPLTRSCIRQDRTARLGGALLAVGAALVVGTLIGLPSSAMVAPASGVDAQLRAYPQVRANIGNPVAGNDGFTVFVRGNATVSSNENEGTMALGGNLTLGDNYRIANHPPTHPFVAAGDTQPIGLLIGGGIDWGGSAATGQLQVLSGAYVKLGDATGTDVLGTAPTELVPTGASAGSAKRLSLTTTQSATSIKQSGLIDFGAAFAAYDVRSDEMARCPDTVIMTDANGATLSTPLPPNSQVYLNATTTGTNVWTVGAADLAYISNLTLRGTLSASVSLVINVVGANGAFTWNPPSLGGFSSTVAPYVLWNFPGTTTLTLNGANTVEGTIYAPRASLIDLNTGNVEGNIIVDSYQQGGAVGGVNGGEVHDFPFAGEIECGASESASPSPSPSPSETGESESASGSASPSVTESSASASPSASETSASATPSPTAPTGLPTSMASVTPAQPSPTAVETSTAAVGPGGGTLASTGAGGWGVVLLVGMACLGLGAALTIRTRTMR